MATGKKLATWRIVMIRKKGEYIGTVQAADAEAAIKAAIKACGITDPERQGRSVAQRIE